MFENLLIEKYRPQTLDDIVLSDKNRKYFNQIKRKQEIPHLLFHGSPGIGKTTLAKIIVNDILDCQYIYINASDESGVDVIRTKVTNFAQTASLDGKLKVIILDEIDGLSSVKSGNSGTSAQQALRNVIEEYSGNTRFVATCNYRSLVCEPLDSRFQAFDLTPPLEKTTERAINVLKAEKIEVPEEEKSKLADLIKNNYPDIRKIIGEIHKNIYDGKLVLDEQEEKNEFAKEVFKRVREGKIETIRRFVIQNEIKFNNNYYSLLDGLFEAVYESDLDFTKKRPIMLLISEAMLNHGPVLDKEVNAYSCLLQISEII